MERWEVLIDSYTPTPSLRDFIKAIQTAGVVLKESLAPFEIAWILQTLLHKPVNLIATVKGTNNDVVWYKTIGDAFKLLGEVTATHTEALEEHFRDIVDLCLLDLDPKVRHHALSCLAAVARASPLGAEHPERHLACLEAVPTCRAPVALLVGTICECHPAEVANDINKIWRIYLNLLDSHKNTERITTCLLQGILGIFKNFGVDLPTIELTTFYDNLANDYIRRSQCQSVCLQILSNHSDLFKERLSKDISLRTYLWNTLYESEGSKTRDIVKAIYSLYVAICDVLDKGQMQQIATSELLSLAASHRTQVKYASLRIMSHVNSTHGTAVDVAGKTDVQALESELREGTVSYEVAEAVSWCIEANLPNSDKLLQSAVLFYANLPSSRRKEIVVYGILNAPSELRSATITFLISETIESFETHLTLWKDLFDTDKGTDNTVIEKSKLVFEDFMRYLIFVFNEFLEENVETAPEKLLTLLHLTSEILTYQPPECYTNVYCNVVLPLIIRLVRKYPHEATVRVARTLHLHLEDSLASLQELYEIIQVDRCKDEALLCESCLLLIEAADDKVDVANVVTALEIIFSRNDVEPSTLSKALKKLEHTINTGSDSISSSMIHRVEKLRARNDLKGKDARILHRDVIMFLGKYGGKADINDNECIENLNLVKLMETFTLTIQNPEEGSKYKVNLQRILQLALEHEDPNALQTLLTIICANLSTKPDPVLQQILPRVCLALSRAFARGGAADPRGVRAGVALCDGDAGRRVADYISTEKSPGVRRMLSDALETQLRAEGGALGAAVAEQVMGLLKSDVSTTRRAGLDLTETLIAAFDKNHRLSEIFLPDLILLIPKTREPNCENTFEVATAQFMEKIELFDGDIVENLVKDLLRFLLHKQNGGEIKMADVEANVYKKTVTKVLGFAEKVCVYKNHDKFTIIETIFEIFSDDCVFVNLMYVLAAIRKVFDYDTDLCRLVLSYNECFVLNQLFCMGVCQDYFSTEAVLVFLQEYADISLELQYENTLAFVAKIIENLYPDHVKYLHKTVKSCLSAFVKNRTPAILITAIENWCNKMALQDITRSIEKELFTEKHAEIVFTINTLIDAIHLSDMSTLTEIQNASKEWTMTLLKLFSRDYITEYLQSKMAYLTDLLSVSVKFLTLTDIKKIATEGCAVEGVSTESIGVKFCRYFIPVFYQIFLRKPYVLLEKELSRCSLLLNDIVKFTVKKKCDEEQIDSVLELVDKLWPTYSSYATLHQKQSLLQDMMNLPKKLDPESNPLLWAVSVISSDARREEKARIIGVLPRGDAYSQAYRTFAATLPTRLSDLDQESSASFRALLDALAMTKDRVLLDIITTLASGDDATGWWDSALESLAFDMDMALYNAVYTHCWEGMSLGVCRRVMLPLLRHSTPSFCEEFFSTILPDLLNVKEVKTASSQYKYHKYIVDYTRVFMLLQVAFEKIPLQSLESPNSLLYTKLKPTQLWHLIRVTCNLCISLRTKKTLPEGASAALKEDYRLFQCANYNCLSAAICRRKPEDHKFYNVLFDPAIWNKLVDDSKEYKIYIQPQWVNISQAQNRRTRRQAVSIHVESSSSTLRSTPRTLRTRMFLRTLSENPAQYDLTEIEEEEIEIQEIVLEESELNRHECAGAMTALLRHMPSLQSLSQALSKTMSAGVQWLVAQVIINCKEELKPQASDLRPALLDIIASTAIERNGKKVLNGLHVNILETLIHWSDDDPHSSPSLDATIELLLATCIEHRIHSSLFYTLLDVLSKFLEIYGPVATVKWSVFEGYQNDPAALKTFEILKRVAKAKIYIAELLPALLDRMESKQAIQTPKLAELFGLALVTCPEKEQYFNRFKKILDKLRSINGAEYVKVLFYAQIGCHKCCDEYNFRKIIDITTKMVGAEQTKCFRILATFIENSPQNDYVTELYDTIDLGEFVIEESVEAMAVVKVGMKHIRDNTKRRLVTQIAGYCTHSLVKVRTAACEVVLAAFDDLFSKNEAMPPPKRAKITTTVMIGAILDKDVYSSAILNAISCGVTDGDSGIQSMVRGRMGDRLSKNMGSRFTEAFLFTVYLPCTTNNNQDMSVCVSALLELLFSHLKRQQRFRELKLKDEPLEIRETSSGPSKLLTMSRTYQGTFRGSMALTSGRKARQIQATNETPDIDVQISIDKILDTFLQFSKETSETASAFCLEFVKSLIANQFEQGNTIATCLKTILDKPSNELTPFVVDLCHVFINEVSKIEGFLKTAENLKLATKNTEGDQITKQLYQDVKLRSTGFDQFVLGTKLKDEEDQDVVMDDESQFSVEDLTSAFGKLSNWDTLTSQEKRKIMASGLPPLWTDKENFKQLIEDFSAPNNWFGRMLSAYRQEDKEYTMKWMREIDKWPRRHFAVSAITEAIEWQTSQDAELRSMCDIQPSDCLAEWAGRLMIRTAYINALNAESEPTQREVMLPRLHELAWCERANERWLSKFVLDCVSRNTDQELFNQEMLPWLLQKLLVLRDEGLSTGSGALSRALAAAEAYTPQFIKQTEDSVVWRMYHLILMLNRDLDSLSKEKIQDILQQTNERIKENHDSISDSKHSLYPIYELAAGYYDDLWNEAADSEERNNILSDLLDVLGSTIDLGINNEGLLALVLNKLDDFNLDLRPDLAKMILDKIQLQIETIDDFSLNQLQKHANLFPSRLLNDYPFMRERDGDLLTKYKRCFQLICDAEYSLMQYCILLKKALENNDQHEWEVVFSRMKSKMFDNPYAGSDFQMLTKFKNKLYEICEYDSTPTFKTSADKTLKDIIRQLRVRPPQSTLRLSQLCPALGGGAGGCAAALLGLRGGGAVLRIEEAVQIYTASERRPALITVLLSNGTKKRYLHKSGEPLKVDAAAQNVMRFMQTLWKRERGYKDGVIGYNVTPLSEDCGLIEFLEDHIELRKLIASTSNIDVLDSVNRPMDHELILSPSQTALTLHSQMCSKIPSFCLRSAIHKRCVSERDRTFKMAKFMHSVCAASVVTWILGLGDRHLENILYSIQDGGVCHVDWAAVFRRGVMELPPARLTRNIVAVCDELELEAALQQLLTTLRRSHTLLGALIRMSFNWMGDQFQLKYPQIESLLQGATQSHQVTRQTIEDSSLGDLEKTKYLELLDGVFEGFQVKESYSVEEQISSFLRHCTDPRILSVTRSGWEPWI